MVSGGGLDQLKEFLENKDKKALANFSGILRRHVRRRDWFARSVCL